ncbi:MAG: DNA/RNA-binding domain of Phe-tRNA-synthetase-like protein [Planctomycetota bacterium]|jgi:DNA/RNA-binding domain of Phe-tRNA-synthetase-like protein
MVGSIAIADLPLLMPLGFEAIWPKPLGEMEATDISAIVQSAPEAAERDEGMQKVVRSLLRAGGYKPSGRGKPASEYLQRAAGEGPLPTINPAVDILNAVSLVSGIPISVVDLDLVQAPLSVRNGDEGAEYIFNASDQTIKVEGLLCLHDKQGPCATAVKDSQRTKTTPGTTRTLTWLWAPKASESISQAAFDWLCEATRQAGAQVRIL